MSNHFFLTAIDFGFDLLEKPGAFSFGGTAQQGGFLHHVFNPFFRFLAKIRIVGQNAFDRI